MRKIVANLFVSLDGVVESPEQWTGPYFSEDIGQMIGSELALADTMLLGRATYQAFAAAFAQSKIDNSASGREQEQRQNGQQVAAEGHWIVDPRRPCDHDREHGEQRQHSESIGQVSSDHGAFHRHCSTTNSKVR